MGAFRLLEDSENLNLMNSLAWDNLVKLKPLKLKDG